MSRFQQIMELLEPSPTFVYKSKSSFLLPFYPPLGVEEEESELGLGFTLDLLNPNPNPNSSEQMHSSFIPSEFFSASFDLIQLERTPFSSSFKRYQARSGTPSSLRSLCDRISALEAGFDKARKSARETDGGDRKYKWTAEIKGNGEERKYKLVADVKVGQERNYKLTAEMKGKGTDGPISRAYTFRSSAVPSGGAVVDGKKKKKEKAKGSAKVVEIEEADPAAHALQQVFAKRKALAIKNNKEKRKELSPQDAALIIQTSFRQHLGRRSQVLRALRELAVAKARLKEIRACFSNFYYRRRVAYNAEERQRFSEKIIVLLLTVEAIEGADLIVRATRRSMVDELEAMLEAVDPQPPEKLGSMKRRNFDLPLAGSVEKEMAARVSEVVQMLDQDDNESSAFSGGSP